jgi:hypothetical protein
MPDSSSRSVRSEADEGSGLVTATSRPERSTAHDPSLQAQQAAAYASLLLTCPCAAVLATWHLPHPEQQVLLQVLPPSLAGLYEQPQQGQAVGSAPPAG